MSFVAQKPVKITWEFPIEWEDMGKIRPDLNENVVHLMFSSAEKADAFYNRCKSAVDELSEAEYPIHRSFVNPSALFIQLGSNKIFSIVTALHDSIRKFGLQGVQNPYKFTLIE